jgi:hypothetical protein
MGRVIYQEDEDDNDDVFPHSPQAQPQERDEQLSHPITDNSDKLLLLQSIETITQLAVMDRDEYQRRLVENSLPVVQVGSSDHNLAKLTQSVHRFHSLVANLERENDSQTLEIYKLQTLHETVKERNQKLETAVQKLHKRNTKLKKEKGKKFSIGKKILDSVNKSKSLKQEHEFLKLATKVQQHETALRERTLSNFSDLDGLEAFYSTGDDSMNGSEADYSAADASVSTTTSLITDESAATVRISRERTFTWPKLHSEDNDIMVDPVPTTSKSKSTTTSPSKPSKPSAVLSESNPFAAFMAPKVAQPYTLSFGAPYPLQLVQIPIEESTTTTSSSEEGSASHHAVCICGYHGFDASTNVKPTLGARLLEINKEKLDPKWTTLEIEKQMMSQGNRTSMTFRNDTWDKKQKEVLTAAVAQQEKLHPTALRKRSKSGESLQKNLLGFLNFNHHGERPATPEKKTTPPRPTTTTPPQQADISPIQDMIAFLRTNHVANTTPEEGVTFDDQAAHVAFPTTPEEALTTDDATVVVDLKPKVQAMVTFDDQVAFPTTPEKALTTDDATVVVDLNPKVQAIETDESLAIPSLEEKQPAASTSAAIATIATAAATAPKSPLKTPEINAADAFKSSIMNMGKLFAFR